MMIEMKARGGEAVAVDVVCRSFALKEAVAAEAAQGLRLAGP